MYQRETINWDLYKPGNCKIVWPDFRFNVLSSSDAGEDMTRSLLEAECGVCHQLLLGQERD